MTLRLAKKEDEPEILALSKRIGDSPLDSSLYSSYLNNPQILFYSFVEDRLCGYVILRLEGEEAELDEIVISQELEGKGKGSLLLRLSLDELKKRNVRTCYLEVRTKNRRAISLYERFGFRFYRKRKNYYPDDDALCYGKELDL